MKMPTIMSGWSSHGGQTLSPYAGEIEENETLIGHSVSFFGKNDSSVSVIDDAHRYYQAPGGSSTGSAVAVAAGFSPLAMGTETVGSIVTPSTRAGLYALKLIHGSLDTTGVYALSEFFDCVGPMAKSAADVRLMTEILLKRTFGSAKMGTWEGLS